MLLVLFHTSQNTVRDDFTIDVKSRPNTAWNIQLAHINNDPWNNYTTVSCIMQTSNHPEQSTQNNAERVARVLLFSTHFNFCLHTSLCMRSNPKWLIDHYPGTEKCLQLPIHTCMFVTTTISRISILHSQSFPKSQYLQNYSLSRITILL